MVGICMENGSTVIRDLRRSADPYAACTEWWSDGYSESGANCGARLERLMILNDSNCSQINQP